MTGCATKSRVSTGPSYTASNTLQELLVVLPYTYRLCGSCPRQMVRLREGTGVLVAVGKTTVAWAVGVVAGAAGWQAAKMTAARAKTRITLRVKGMVFTEVSRVLV
jgi:hypothetical protein